MKGDQNQISLIDKNIGQFYHKSERFKKRFDHPKYLLLLSIHKQNNSILKWFYNGYFLF
ncbi:hypothetical protein CHCC20335_2202 [Bacillus paralicheniformis]|nr:hypothetical protein CHCC20335_2202 [Bacillus paralicheniformis]